MLFLIEKDAGFSVWKPDKLSLETLPFQQKVYIIIDPSLVAFKT